MQLSPQNEQFLDQVVAGGLFPSRDAAIDAAIDALREKTEKSTLVDEEHMEAVEQGLDEADAGLTEPVTDEYWAQLREYIAEIGRRGGDDRGNG